MKERFPDTPFTITRRWTGPIIEPIDGLPYIGRLSRHNRVLVATGFSGNGMTYSTVAAMILTDLVLGNDNAWAQVYDPARSTSFFQLYKKGRDYLFEFFGGAARNFFAKR